LLVEFLHFDFSTNANVSSGITWVRQTDPVGISLDLAPAGLAFEGLKFVCIAV
jgi:hypothetical protein